MPNIDFHAKSQLPSIKNDRVVALSEIYSKATPPRCHTSSGCHTPKMPQPLYMEMPNIDSHAKSQLPSIKND